MREGYGREKRRADDVGSVSLRWWNTEFLERKPFFVFGFFRCIVGPRVRVWLLPDLGVEK